MTDYLKEILEWTVLGLNVVFLFLIIKEIIWCWPFGILASAISVFLFIDASLFSETLLYSVYVILGVYAWINWHKNSKKTPMPILVKQRKYHLVTIIIGGALWLMLGYFFDTFTSSKLPWADAATTSFAFVATYLEAKKILHHWVYWILVNAFSVWLYHTRELKIMAVMMIGFTIFSIVGYIIWKQRFRNQELIKPDVLL